MTRWEKHVKRWSNCQRCPLHKCRRNVVLLRGEVPCDILFCGEAPGENEDREGLPFWGQAGHKLDAIIEAALGDLDGGSFFGFLATGSPGHLPSDLAMRTDKLRMAWTNVVACIPRDEDGGKATEPPDQAIKACAPRLKECMDLCKPGLVVCVGKLATKWVRKLEVVPEGIAICDLTHPAAILRGPEAMRSIETRRAAVVLRKAIKEFLEVPF